MSDLLWLLSSLARMDVNVVVVGESPEREELPLSSQEEEEQRPCPMAAELLGRFKSAKDDLDDRLASVMGRVDEAIEMEEPVRTGWYVNVCESLRDANTGSARMEMAFRQIREHEGACSRARNYRQNVQMLGDLRTRVHQLGRALKIQETISNERQLRIRQLELELKEQHEALRLSIVRVRSLEDSQRDDIKPLEATIAQQKRLLRVLARRNTALHIRLSIEKKIAKERPASKYCVVS